MVVLRARSLIVALLLGLIACDAAWAGPKPVALKPIVGARDFASIGRTVYFTGALPDGPNGVWRSDGTRKGTKRLSGRPRTGAREPEQLTPAGDLLFFDAGSPETGRELWRSDGTRAGTRLIRDVFPGSRTSRPRLYVEIGDEVFFTARDEAHGRELWRSDGTRSGTGLVSDLVPGPRGSRPEELTAAAGTLYFSDKTKSGPVIYALPSGASEPELLATLPGVHAELQGVEDGLFAVLWAKAGDQLWHSDGTPAGTRVVKQLNSGVENRQSPQLAAVGDLLFFMADDGVHGDEVWRSDGTPGGTYMVKDVHPTSSSSPDWFTPSRGTLYFTATDGVHGYELWRSDGTSQGTTLVADVSRGVGPWNPFAYRGEVFFGTSDRHGNEPWRSDGTPAGTRLIADLAPGRKGSLPNEFAAAGKNLFFNAWWRAAPTDLWRLSLRP
jgi:ELWxxDGT repeat protein